MPSHLSAIASKLAEDLDSVNDPYTLFERIAALELRCSLLESKYVDLQNYMTRGDSQLHAAVNTSLDRAERAIADLRNELDAR